MASLYSRARSPFWWIEFREKGRKVMQSTGLRVCSEEETAEAEVIRAQRTLKEKRAQQRDGNSYDWEWVRDWLDGHCQNQRTLAAYLLHWRHIRHWLVTAGIHHPREITFRHGQAYVAWRTGARAGHKVCGKNTALQEVKLLGMILRQCALRGEIGGNPLHQLGISRDAPAEKRELTEREISACLEALSREEEWLRLSFLIALHTGCRLRETRLKMSLVDFDRRVITFESPKGGSSRAFSRPLPSALLPILKPLRAREFSHEFPFQPSRCFQNFFQRAGVSGVSFHCLRVSYVTRLHRAAVPLAAAMRLVNHSSQVVHRIYQRLNVDDVRPYGDVPLFSTKPQNPSA